MGKTFALLLLGFLVIGAEAALEPVSPKDDATLVLLTEVQKKIMAVPTYDERLALLKDDGKIAKNPSNSNANVLPIGFPFM